MLIGKLQAQDGRIFICKQGFAKGFAHQRRLFLEVHLVAAKVEQLGVDDRKARLAAGLGGDAGDQLIHAHQLGLILAHQLGRF